MRSSYRAIIATQLFDQDSTSGEVIGTLTLTEQDGQTTLTNARLLFQRSLDAVLRTPMDKGTSRGYDQLETLLPSL